MPLGVLINNAALREWSTNSVKNKFVEVFLSTVLSKSSNFRNLTYVLIKLMACKFRLKNCVHLSGNLQTGGKYTNLASPFKFLYIMYLYSKICKYIACLNLEITHTLLWNLNVLFLEKLIQTCHQIFHSYSPMISATTETSEAQEMKQLAAILFISSF